MSVALLWDGMRCLCCGGCGVCYIECVFVWSRWCVEDGRVVVLVKCCKWLWFKWVLQKRYSSLLLYIDVIGVFFLFLLCCGSRSRKR